MILVADIPVVIVGHFGIDETLDFDHEHCTRECVAVYWTPLAASYWCGGVSLQLIPVLSELRASSQTLNYDTANKVTYSNADYILLISIKLLDPVRP